MGNGDTGREGGAYKGGGDGCGGGMWVEDDDEPEKVLGNPMLPVVG